MTEITQRILDEVEARLVELGTDAGNASKDDDVPPPLQSDVSSDEDDDGDSSDDEDAEAHGAGAKRKADSFSKI